MQTVTSASFRNVLEELVRNHPVLTTNRWLEKKESRMEKEDLLLWLRQEYFVSVDFVNWFLNTAAICDSVEAKIVLVSNIWEELGEGNVEDSHVFILKKFLSDMGEVVHEKHILPETISYLDLMQKITTSDFYSALGALGPANEYLLKLEYSRMFKSYLDLRKRIVLPEGKFFQVNLNADESHSEKLFRLIEAVADTEEKRNKVMEGNRLALDARLVFYEGLTAFQKL
ncbi:iron-containing redox enzyme family protein [Leptospira noguchii]|uniref:Iron-containing redox enzyme family protein n=1 Tax=Leptospira noguchii TaxID=28182 RepID=A0A9Q8RL37_9LEPT|nr:iron-containing redox enzyme family protein [Leptospira noguchii]TQE78150.1 iron-containing redox enzyme family protein [Leptospira noguchii]UOG31613.1 iron-containing redox enzyme family protein [Leptospira noguchii]UOG33259.1 iron-containing redox enzyme family protein [Leptospira noguchii]UOG42632.1 iron-containing redox enzyme family protein [Leptospira noguchii]UOG44080.1 iron-containing redox enzyme family protein [Leptospira noguchii]